MTTSYCLVVLDWMSAGMGSGVATTSILSDVTLPLLMP